MNTPSGLCETCRHRADSIRRVQEWRDRGGKGMVADPAPKIECKDHAGYGLNATRTHCSDYSRIGAPPL